MLRRELIGQMNSFIHALRLNQPSVFVEIALDEFAMRQRRQLPCDLFFHGFQDFARGRDEPEAVVLGAMLALSEQISGNVIWGLAVSSASTSTSLGPGSNANAAYPNSKRIAATT